jgi:hypothetical protein
MIFHVNRLTFKVDVTQEQRREGMDLLRQQGTAIDAVQSFVVGPELGADYEWGAVFVIEDLEGYWEYLTHPAHFRSEQMGLHLVERFEAFDVTDSEDPEMGGKISALHARSYAENPELARLVSQVPTFAVPDGTGTGA